MAQPASSKSHSFQAPKGTRDLYPADLLKRRYIEKMWRDTAIRHGFEEIDGPTFEHLDLYTVKSGEGIVSELFSFRREGGEKDYALRPEFTPTLARMYAAKAGGLPKPTKWFWQQNCFRAEKPQRGRLREFGQWNVDVMGDGSGQSDADIVQCCVGMLESAGLTPAHVRVRISSREWIDTLLDHFQVSVERRVAVYAVLDARAKLSEEEFLNRARGLDLSNECISALRNLGAHPIPLTEGDGVFMVPFSKDIDLKSFEPGKTGMVGFDLSQDSLLSKLRESGIVQWCDIDLSVVRGLAYYTGAVFEVHEAGGKERAIAGGGRYDKLIEMFGGPPTPAVGFGMGDVVLSLVLEDRGLMPHGQALLDKLSEPPASLRPDVFVISNGQPESDAAVRPLVAKLRRGEAGESNTGGMRVPPLHARHTYKATKNIGKLLQEASAVHSRFAAIVENTGEVTLKNLATQDQKKVAIDGLGGVVAGV